MGSMYGAFETSKEMERQGIWLDYGDFRLRIARAGGSNKNYQKAMEAKTRPHRKAIEAESFENDRALEILKEVYADHVVLAWETKQDGEWISGIEAQDGSLLPFGRDNVVATFTNLPDLFTEVQQQASKANLYRAQLLEEAAKN